MGAAKHLQVFKRYLARDVLGLHDISSLEGKDVGFAVLVRHVLAPVLEFFDVVRRPG